MECIMCGSKLSDGDSLCRVCGSPVKQVNQNLDYNNFNNMEGIINSNQGYNNYPNNGAL